jgi:hypothetical protein
MQVSDEMKHTFSLQLAVRYATKEITRRFGACQIERSTLFPNVNPPEDVCYIAANIGCASLQRIIVGAVVSIEPVAISSSVYSAKLTYEWEVPTYDTCPPYILEVLDRSSNPKTKTWRRACASKPWNYTIIVEQSPSLTFSVELALELEGATQKTTLESHKNLTNEEFSFIYERMIMAYPMARIDDRLY